MLASPEGRLGLVASSSDAMRLLELFERRPGRPLLDAFRTGVRVEQQDLEAESGPLAVDLRRRPQGGFPVGVRLAAAVS